MSNRNLVYDTITNSISQIVNEHYSFNKDDFVEPHPHDEIAERLLSYMSECHSPFAIQYFPPELQKAFDEISLFELLAEMGEKHWFEFITEDIPHFDNCGFGFIQMYVAYGFEGLYDYVTATKRERQLLREDLHRECDDAIAFRTKLYDSIDKQLSKMGVSLNISLSSFMDLGANALQSLLERIFKFMAWQKLEELELRQALAARVRRARRRFLDDLEERLAREREESEWWWWMCVFLAAQIIAQRLEDLYFESLESNYEDQEIFPLFIEDEGYTNTVVDRTLKRIEQQGDIVNFADDVQHLKKHIFKVEPNIIPKSQLNAEYQQFLARNDADISGLKL